MSEDRELLEAAAKAAGYDDAKYKDMEGWGEVRYGFSSAIWSEKLYDTDGSGYWNPLVDDAQALRLAVKLRIDVEFTYGGIEVMASWRVNNIFGGNVVEEIGSLRNGDEPSAAVRRAIVRAAASLAAREAP